jgi:hypothetical protein
MGFVAWEKLAVFLSVQLASAIAQEFADVEDFTA